MLELSFTPFSLHYIITIKWTKKIEYWHKEVSILSLLNPPSASDLRKKIMVFQLMPFTTKGDLLVVHSCKSNPSTAVVFKSLEMNEPHKADGSSRPKYTLGTFYLQGWVCGKCRLQGLWKWSGKPEKEESSELPQALCRSESGHGTVPGPRNTASLLLVCVATARGFSLLSTPKKQGAECPGLCI